MTLNKDDLSRSEGWSSSLKWAMNPHIDQALSWCEHWQYLEPEIKTVLADNLCLAREWHSHSQRHRNTDLLWAPIIWTCLFSSRWKAGYTRVKERVAEFRAKAFGGKMRQSQHHFIKCLHRSRTLTSSLSIFRVPDIYYLYHHSVCIVVSKDIKQGDKRYGMSAASIVEIDASRWECRWHGKSIYWRGLSLCKQYFLRDGRSMEMTMGRETFSEELCQSSSITNSTSDDTKGK